MKKVKYGSEKQKQKFLINEFLDWDIIDKLQPGFYHTGLLEKEGILPTWYANTTLKGDDIIKIRAEWKAEWDKELQKFLKN